MSTLSGKTARRVALPDGFAVDPFALAGSDGHLLRSDGTTLVGLGTAARLPLPDGLDDPDALEGVLAELSSVTCDDELGRASRTPAPVLAFGALPFDRSLGGALVVPEITVGLPDEGPAWLTVLAPGAFRLPRRPAELHEWLDDRATTAGAPMTATATAASTANLVEHAAWSSSDEHFEAIVAEALAAIGRGEIAKVVLARHVDVTFRHPVEVTSLLRRWSGLEPACTIFSVPTGADTLVGASPELLVERSLRRARSRPLAGTAGRSADPGSDAGSADLRKSVKDAREHRLVVEAIASALAPYSRDLDAPDHPELVHLRSMTHLGTEVGGTLDMRTDRSVPHVLELLAALHPTPAVGGVPTEEACALIDRLEPLGRGRYAGPVGYVDAAGDGRWVVGIRSATLRGRRAAFAAGVGIVEGSEPGAERAEVDLKLRSVLGALAPGNTLEGTADARYSNRPARAGAGRTPSL